VQHGRLFACQCLRSLSRIALGIVRIPLSPHKVRANDILPGGPRGHSIVLSLPLRR